MGISTNSTAHIQLVFDRDLDELLGRSGSNLQCALAHAKAGRPVFPCLSKSGFDKKGKPRKAKAPLTENGFYAATTDEFQIRQWWSQYPDAMPAIPMGRASGLAVLDLDVKDGKDGIAALRDLGVNPDTLSPCQVETMSGGKHLYFRCPEGLGCSVDKVAPGVDVRGEGGYVIAPGATGAAGAYSAADPVPDELPEWPASLPTGRPAAPRRETLAALLGDDDDDLLRDYFDARWADDLPRVRSALKAIPANLPYDDWFKIGMALHHGSAGSQEAFGLWYEWSQTAPEAAANMNKGGDRAWRQKWESFATRTYKGQTVRLGTLFHVAKAHGWSEELAILLGEIPAKNDPAAPLPAESKGEKVGLIVAGNGNLKPTLHNAVLMLRKVNREQDYRIRLNDMSGRGEWRGGQIGDGELGAFRVAMEQAGMHNVGTDLTAHAVKMVAQRDRYHPVKDWLNGLAHDGTPRLDTWLTRYLGAEDSPYVRAIGRAFLIAMVARVMQPGCKHDHVLVLKGGQGARKSTACRILSGDAYFSDTMPAIRNDKIEAWRHLRGKWLVELAELAPSRKADAEDLKSFLSGQVDSYRMPYARLEETVPRQCVFVGTTNEDAFLRDATGGRRFWPATCGAIDTEALAEDRGQLFAEAVAAYRAGEAWHLSPEMERLAAVEQESAREEDPWEGPIREYLTGPTEDPIEPKARDRVTTADVLKHLGVLNERQTSAHARRVAGVLRIFGWSRDHTRTGNVWMRP